MKALAGKSESLALELFQNGRNCAQSVLNGVLEIVYGEKGLDYDSKNGWRIARGFGGGMAVGEMCGAITGGIIALGISIDDSNKDVRNFVKDIVTNFKHEYGNVRCEDIKDKPKCKKYVAHVARYTTEILERTK